MTIFIDSIPKNEDGNIILSPGASYMIDDKEMFLDGVVEVLWFQENFNTIANASCPLSDELFQQLKAIGRYWELNAINWREQGLI